MYGVFFRAGEFAFVDPGEFATRVVKTWQSTHDATADLAAVGAGLDLGGAPIASWVLARLTEISESSVFPGDHIGRCAEVGGFRIRMLAVRGTELIAKLRLTAEFGETELTATAADKESAEAAARGLIAKLAAEPAALGRCRIEVRARELGGRRNEYGYDGTILLGRHNVNG